MAEEQFPQDQKKSKFAEMEHKVSSFLMNIFADEDDDIEIERSDEWEADIPNFNFLFRFYFILYRIICFSIRRFS